MLISPNIEIANICRIVSALGWCFFDGIWISFAVSFENTNPTNVGSKIQFIAYTASIIFFISNLIYKPSKIVDIEAYGFVNNIYSFTTIGAFLSIYIVAFYITGIIIIYFKVKNSHKNRVRKQMKIIVITSLISFCIALISDFILPTLGINVFPSGIITTSIGVRQHSHQAKHTEQHPILNKYYIFLIILSFYEF